MKQFLTNRFTAILVLPVLLWMAGDLSRAQLSAPRKEAPPNFDIVAERVEMGEYTGPHASDPEFQKVRNDLFTSRADMLREIYDLTGLTLPPGKTIVVEFNDNPVRSPDPNAVTFATTQPTARGARITYSIANVLKGPDPRQMLQHEMFHAIQLSNMDSGSYDRIHPWVKEGLAVYASGEGPVRVVNRYFAAKRRGEDPRQLAERVVDGLLSRGKATDYDEEYLAFLFFEKEFGADALRQFVKEITHNRTPWQNALKQITGLDWRDFADDARKFSIDYIVNIESAPQPPTRIAKSTPAETPSSPSAATPAAPLPLAPSPLTPRPVFGAVLQNLDAESAKQVPGGKGVLVMAVRRNTIADQSGIEAGDIIINFNGRSPESSSQLQSWLQAIKVGSSVPVTVVREGKSLSLTVLFGDQP